MRFALAVAIAINFWSARGVDVPCTPVAVPGADAQLPLDSWGVPFPMATLTDGCRILLSRQGGALRVDAPVWYCAEIVHEVGHLAGLPHSARGIMAATVYADALPHDCEHWKRTARKLVKRWARTGSRGPTASGSSPSVSRLSS